MLMNVAVVLVIMEVHVSIYRMHTYVHVPQDMVALAVNYVSHISVCELCLICELIMLPVI